MKMKTRQRTQATPVSGADARRSVTELSAQEVDQVSGGVGYLKPSATVPAATPTRIQKTTPFSR
ncbi:hypothetical protein HUS70_10675 [Pandoraea nosoerga]|uniref:Uncharacterized protein n=1 Tax=Pandoraea nosoerga TaxID=2508296 RepID=A0A5E4WA38_9BURK|nr:MULTISPECIES: hypothetical protein [Pandoraea]MBN4665862.1 hypothetical protein [Pandoraea nosoerga]MBN4676036.1 hypothetical protein [Pandoraea nosoerga]MBN4681907.1 hypothetical protein [Pandoraea nosoerga]MBN4745095.1 hypothetical protein [Pandoraea nosoerga]VVE20739.1 hypothetical protein PNO31109_03116 [Pandoraea nosoerga]